MIPRSLFTLLGSRRLPSLRSPRTTYQRTAHQKNSTNRCGESSNEPQPRKLLFIKICGSLVGLSLGNTVLTQTRTNVHTHPVSQKHFPSPEEDSTPQAVSKMHKEIRATLSGSFISALFLLLPIHLIDGMSMVRGIYPNKPLKEIFHDRLMMSMNPSKSIRSMIAILLTYGCTNAAIIFASKTIRYVREKPEELDKIVTHYNLNNDRTSWLRALIKEHPAIFSTSLIFCINVPLCILVKDKSLIIEILPHTTHKKKPLGLYCFFCVRDSLTAVALGPLTKKLEEIFEKTNLSDQNIKFFASFLSIEMMQFFSTIFHLLGLSLIEEEPSKNRINTYKTTLCLRWIRSLFPLALGPPLAKTLTELFLDKSTDKDIGTTKRSTQEKN